MERSEWVPTDIQNSKNAGVGRQYLGQQITDTQFFRGYFHI